MKKRFLCVLLVLALLAGTLSIPAFAADAVDSGSCGAAGANLSWTFYDNDLLVIDGTSAASFSPNDTCTRGQVVTFLYRAYQ